MKLQILISTINRNINKINHIFLEPNEDISYLISHQITKNKDYYFRNNRYDVFYIQTYSKGLSKNRNNCLIHANGEICLIGDDDVKYNIHKLKKIIHIFKNYPNADIITFKAQNLDKNLTPFRVDYPNKPFWHNFLSVFYVSSIEIAFRLKSVKNKKLIFDSFFGLGSVFPGGEEIIFLQDALKEDLKILYYPLFIVSHPKEQQNKRLMSNEENIRILGAKFYRHFGIFCIFPCLISLIFNLINPRISLFKFLKNIIKGNIECFKIIPWKNQYKILKYLIKQISLGFFNRGKSVRRIHMG